MFVAIFINSRSFFFSLVHVYYVYVLNLDSIPSEITVTKL